MQITVKALRHNYNQSPLSKSTSTNSEGGSKPSEVRLHISICQMPYFLTLILESESLYPITKSYIMRNYSQSCNNENNLYKKWSDIFSKCLYSRYHNVLDDAFLKKIARINADYLISIFRPIDATYIISIEKINYICQQMMNFTMLCGNNNLCNKLSLFMLDFISAFSGFMKAGSSKNVIDLSIFDANQKMQEHFGSTYSTYYNGSFRLLFENLKSSELRHLPCNINHSIGFFTPLIIKKASLAQEWYRDIQSLSNNCPCGTLIAIQESGNLRDFKTKVNRVCCSTVLPELANQTKLTLKKYLISADCQPLEHQDLCLYKI
jgi:hypothetical protein